MTYITTPLIMSVFKNNFLQIKYSQFVRQGRGLTEKSSCHFQGNSLKYRKGKIWKDAELSFLWLVSGASGHNCPVNSLGLHFSLQSCKIMLSKEHKIALELFREIGKHISILGIITSFLGVAEAWALATHPHYTLKRQVFVKTRKKEIYLMLQCWKGQRGPVSPR